MSTDTGLMMYCYKHDQGCLILGNRVPKNIWKCCCNTQNLHSCDWEDVGTFKVHNESIINLCPSFDNWDRDNSGNWKSSYFLQNIYNSNMEQIELSKKSGMVLQCFQHNQICLFLSDKLPNSGLDHLCTHGKSKSACCEWEDIGTFHIQENEVVLHDKINTVENIEIYDANLKKIHIHSY